MFENFVIVLINCDQEGIMVPLFFSLLRFNTTRCTQNIRYSGNDDLLGYKVT